MADNEYAEGEQAMPMAAPSMGRGMRGPMNTNQGKHPGVKRISKHPMKTMTSKKSQQMKGCC